MPVLFAVYFIVSVVSKFVVGSDDIMQMYPELGNLVESFNTIVVSIAFMAVFNVVANSSSAILKPPTGSFTS